VIAQITWVAVGLRFGSVTQPTGAASVWSKFGNTGELASCTGAVFLSPTANRVSKYLPFTPSSPLI